jgi:hypothetical protein
MPGTSPGMTTLLWLTEFRNEKAAATRSSRRSPHYFRSYLL